MAQINHLLADAYSYKLSGPGINPNKYGNSAQTLEKIVSQIIGVLTVIAVIWFIIQIIFAGYSFISSQGDPKVMEASRKRLTEGVLGLVIVVVAVGLASLLATLAGIPNILSIDSMLSNMGLNP